MSNTTILKYAIYFDNKVSSGEEGRGGGVGRGGRDWSIGAVRN